MACSGDVSLVSVAFTEAEYHCVRRAREGLSVKRATQVACGCNPDQPSRLFVGLYWISANRKEELS